MKRKCWMPRVIWKCWNKTSPSRSFKTPPPGLHESIRRFEANEPQKEGSTQNIMRSIFVPDFRRTAQHLSLALAGLLFFLLISGQTLFAANTEEEAYTIAVGLYNDGLLDLARDQLEHFLKNFPDSKRAPYIQFLLGECDYGQKKYESAIQQYQAGLTNYPENRYRDKMLYRLGRSYLLSGHYNMAQQAFRELIESSPQSSHIQDAYNWLGESYFKQSQYQEALQAYSELITRFPEYHMLDYAYYSRAWSYLNLQQYDKALEDFRYVLETYPDKDFIPSVKMYIARILLMTGQYEEASQDYLAILQEDLGGQNREALFWLAESAYKLGRYDAALQHYREFLEQPAPKEYTDNAENSVAWILLKLGRAQEAIQQFQHFLANYPDSELAPSALFQLASLLLQEGQTTQGIQKFEEYLSRYPDSDYTAEVLFQLGQTYFDQGFHEKSYERFQQLIETASPWYLSLALFMNGSNLYAQQRYDEAMNSYERALEQAQHDLEDAQAQDARANAEQVLQDARFQIGLCHFKQERYDESISQFSQLLAYNDSELPYKDQVYYWIGEASFNQQRYTAALEAYQHLLREYPQSSVVLEVQYSAAWTYYALGQAEEALTAFEQVYQMEPRGELAADALLQAGNNALSIEKYTKAETLYQQIEQEFSGSRQAYQAMLRLGESYYREQQFEKAKSTLDQALSTIPDDAGLSPEQLADAYNFLGLAYLQTDSPALAIPQFEQVLELTDVPELRANMLFNIAETYYKLEEYQQAESFYSWLLEEYPEAPEAQDAQFSMILSYLQLGDTERYVQTSQQFLRRHNAFPQDEESENGGEVGQENSSSVPEPDANPHVPTVLYQLGEHYVIQQDYKQALKFLQHFMVKYPEHELADESLYGMAWCYLKTQDYPSAIWQFKQLLSQFPQSEHAADAYYGLGSSYFRLDDYQEAIGYYTTLLEKFPDFPSKDRILLDLGTSYLHVTDAVNATAILQQAIEQYPEHTNISELYLKLGYAFTMQEQYEQAIPKFGLAAVGTNTAIAAEAQFRIGECYSKLEKRDKAIVDYLKVVYLYPDQQYWVSNAQFKAASIYEEMGKGGEAMTLYQKIIATSGERELLEQAQKRMNALSQEFPESVD